MGYLKRQLSRPALILYAIVHLKFDLFTTSPSQIARRPLKRHELTVLSTGQLFDEMAHSDQSKAQAEVESLLASVNETLEGQAGKSVFAAGGQITLNDLANPASAGSEKSPIIIRWDSSELGHTSKASLPVADHTGSQAAFARLVTDSEPATYGVEYLLSEGWQDECSSILNQLQPIRAWRD
jgi:hypothetical protein